MRNRRLLRRAVRAAALEEHNAAMVSARARAGSSARGRCAGVCQRGVSEVGRRVPHPALRTGAARARPLRPRRGRETPALSSLVALGTVGTT